MNNQPKFRDLIGFLISQKFRKFKDKKDGSDTEYRVILVKDAVTGEIEEYSIFEADIYVVRQCSLVLPGCTQLLHINLCFSNHTGDLLLILRCYGPN